MLEIDLPPFSINKAWQGKRYKTPAYKGWRKDFGILFKKDNETKETIEGYVEIHYELYLKPYVTCDVDNYVKSINDALVENKIIKDDRFIKKMIVEKFPAEGADHRHIKLKIIPWETSLYKIHSNVKDRGLCENLLPPSKKKLDIGNET